MPYHQALSSCASSRLKRMILTLPGFLHIIINMDSQKDYHIIDHIQIRMPQIGLKYFFP